ncbi:MAG: hypothetical protein Q4E87_05450 [bacterium]|nr:hypothetical protein [bacterium]
MEKFLNKENIVICVVVAFALVQSNYFATKLDVSNLKLDMAQMKSELKDYSDKGDRDILNNIEIKLQKISDKIDRL